MLVSLFSIVLPFVVFLFFKSFLEDSTKNGLIFIILFAFFVVGVVIAISIGNLYYLMLIIPLISFLTYKFFLFFFKNKYGRVPLDTSFDMSWGGWPDRIFSFFFLMLGSVIPYIWMLHVISDIKKEGLFGIIEPQHIAVQKNKGNAFGIAQCTSVDTSNSEDFVFYEFFVDGKKVKGTIAIAKGSGEGLADKYFSVNYSSSKPGENVLLVNEQVTDTSIIKSAGFQ